MSTGRRTLPLAPKGEGGSCQLVEQCLRVFEIGGAETFREQIVYRCEKLASFGTATLVAAEPPEAHGGAQFPELGLLLAGDTQRFVIQLLGRFGSPLPQQQPAFVPVQSGLDPSLSRPFNDLQGFVQQRYGLFHLPANLTSCDKEAHIMWQQ